MLKDIKDNQFDAETKDGVVLVDFWAPWCGPCRMQTPVIESLSDEYDGRVEFLKMNVDEEQTVPQQFGIMSIPTLLVMKDGEVREKLVGYHDQERLSTILDQYID